MKEGFMKCPFCDNEIKQGAKKCQYCKEFIEGDNSGNKEKKSREGAKKYKIIGAILGGIIIIALGIFVGLKILKPNTWQGYYYPTILSEGMEVSGPIFDNYEACKNWALDKLSKGVEAYCSSSCKNSVDGTPICEKVIRTWHPLPGFGEVFEGVDAIREDLIADDKISMTQFLLDTEDLYCGYKVTIQNFADGPNQTWYKQAMVNGSDVPSQRVLAQKLINSMEQNNLFTKIEGYKNRYGKNSYFYNTVRNMGLLHDYLYNFLQADSKLSSFEQFQNLILTDFNSAIEILQGLPGTLEWDYDGFVSSNKDMDYKLASQEDINFSKNMLDIESICEFSIEAVSN